MTPRTHCWWSQAAHLCGATEPHPSEGGISVGLLSLWRRLGIFSSKIAGGTGHFVDDWAGVELVATSQSSCWAFKSFFQQLGLDMKPEKEQLPAKAQKVLGVIVRATEDMLLVEICPKRRDKLLVALLDDLLTTNTLTPDEAQHISGKLGFMATTLFGGMGAAAIQPFNARAHSLCEQKNNKLTFALWASIHTLRQLLMDSRPRSIPWVSQSPTVQAVIYSDAFFQLGERQLKPEQAPELWNPIGRGHPKPMDGASWLGQAIA